MILLLDTSTPTCRLGIASHGSESIDWHEWLAERELSSGLHGFILENLRQAGFGWSDIQAIGVFEGPGSYTGLRIGLTVANTLADSLKIPIVGVATDNWHKLALERLGRGDNDKIVLPKYGGSPNITAPRK